MAQCTARSKRTGQRCGAKAMTGVPVCYHHGGPAALKNRGEGNGNFSTGRYSKYLPKNLAKIHNDVETDGDILETRDSIQLVDMMLADALSRINDEQGYSEKLWGQVRDTVQKLEINLKKADFKKLDETHIELRDLATEGLRQSLTRIEVRQLIQERSKLTEREIKRQVAMRTVLTSEQALLLVATVKGILRDVVTDPEQQALVRRRFAEIEGAVIETGGRVVAGDRA